MKISTFEEYKSVYKKSVEDPEAFWSEVASTFSWKKKWNKVLQWDFKNPDVKWFLDGKLNITENCIDRHLPAKANETAFLWEANDVSEKGLKISYQQLSENVNRLANVLRQYGIKKGDRICIYLP